MTSATRAHQKAEYFWCALVDYDAISNIAMATYTSKHSQSFQKTEMTSGTRSILLIAFFRHLSPHPAQCLWRHLQE